MLGLPPSLLTEWRYTMPVQMIELEEVQMNEASDADLEATVEVRGLWLWSIDFTTCRLCANY
jgi:hypothetical protein